LVIEEKGIYSRKILMSRRLMYWHYFTKTSLVAELILMKILKRAKELTLKGIPLPCSEPYCFSCKTK
jgi:HD superfamily phosphohydrolase